MSTNAPLDAGELVAWLTDRANRARVVGQEERALELEAARFGINRLIEEMRWMVSIRPRARQPVAR